MKSDRKLSSLPRGFFFAYHMRGTREGYVFSLVCLFTGRKAGSVPDLEGRRERTGTGEIEMGSWFKCLGILMGGCLAFFLTVCGLRIRSCTWQQKKKSE